MEERTPSLKGWKQLASLTMIALPTIFQTNIVEALAIFTNLQSLIIQSWLPGAVLMSPNAITSFNTVTQMSHRIFFYIMQNKFSIRHYPVSYKTPENLFSSAQFLSSEVIGLLQTYVSHYSFQSRCNLTVSSDIVPVSAVEHSRRDACCPQCSHIWLQDIAS
jgi:hypothetical protein